ncbi:hypothetical protein DdX_15120 [Ditylenchus destructor]|uniref:Uncharacterized protein n=1 Tax=Ditylenchus destructor TaxID=166010 RepID=A0AAD4QY05_9BILA|nr:hypothetical protein DdX_15120 [Ditylenchus destructor]
MESRALAEGMAKKVTDADGSKETVSNLFHLAAFGSGSVCRRIRIRASIHFGDEQSYQGLVKWLHSDPSQYSPKYLLLLNIKQAIDCDRIVTLIRQAFEDPSGGATRNANAGNQICSFSLHIHRAIGNTFLPPTLASFTLTHPKTGEILSCTMNEGVTFITRSFQKNIDPMILKGGFSLEWEAQ